MSVIHLAKENSGNSSGTCRYGTSQGVQGIQSLVALVKDDFPMKTHGGFVKFLQMVRCVIKLDAWTLHDDYVCVACTVCVCFTLRER